MDNEGPYISWQCVHCGGMVSDVVSDLDNGTILKCPSCEEHTVVLLVAPHEHSAVLSHLVHLQQGRHPVRYEQREEAWHGGGGG